MSMKNAFVRDLARELNGGAEIFGGHKVGDMPHQGRVLGEPGLWNSASLRIAILCITDHPMDDAGPRTVKLVDRVLRSAHRFSGLKQILPDGESVNGTWQRWIDTPGDIDIVLIIDESADDPGYMPPSLACAFTETANPAFADLIHDKALGLIGIVDLRAALRLAS